MAIDWSEIRSTLARIEEKLQAANKALDAVAEDWPLVTRAQLEAALPSWRKEFGSNWSRDVMERRIGQENFRLQRGRGYRVAPEVLAKLGIEADAPTAEPDAGGRS